MFRSDMTTFWDIGELLKIVKKVKKILWKKFILEHFPTDPKHLVNTFEKFSRLKKIDLFALGF